jgi:thiol-disulfide isomerase/thioredoxin
LALQHLRGKPVVLAFFASWCHPCEEELPVLEDFARERGA